MHYDLSPYSHPHSLRPSTEIGVVILKVVVRADLLHQFIVNTEEGDEDADDFEGFPAKPGCVALRVFGEASLGGVVEAGFGLAGSVGLLVLHSAVEGLGFLGLDGGLLQLKDIKFHDFGGRHNADGQVAQAGGVVAEVHAEGPVDVVHYLPSHQQTELHGLDVEVEVPPAEDFLGPGGFQQGFALGLVAGLIQKQRLVSSPFIWVQEAVSRSLGF